MALLNTSILITKVEQLNMLIVNIIIKKNGANKTYQTFYNHEYIEYPKLSISKKIADNYLYYFTLNDYDSTKATYLKQLFENTWCDWNIIYTGIHTKPYIYIPKIKLENMWNIKLLDREDILISLAKGKHTEIITKVFNYNKEHLKNEELLKKLIRLDPGIINLVPNNKKIKYKAIIDELEREKQEEFLRLFGIEVW